MEELRCCSCRAGSLWRKHSPITNVATVHGHICLSVCVWVCVWHSLYSFCMNRLLEPIYVSVYVLICPRMCLMSSEA